MENKFNNGEIVYERIRPAQQLIVRRSTPNIYYCAIPEDLSRKDLVFFERELMPAPLGVDVKHGLITKCIN